MKGRLIYADSEHSADMFYAVGLFIPDPFLFVQDERGERHVVISSLEIDRIRRASCIEHVHDLESIRKLCHKPEGQNPEPAEIIARFLHNINLTTVETPGEFPLVMADRLRRLGISLAPVDELFWPERLCKSPSEVEAIRQALKVTGLGMAAGIQMIRAAEIGADRTLFLDGETLTSERVRGEIDATLVRFGAEPKQTIVSGGVHSADPHERGSGVLQAHSPIILDVFPRMGTTGYWGDMTRTVCRGKAPDRLYLAWDMVLQAQELAFSSIADGQDSRQIHENIVTLFAENGFPTGLSSTGRYEGFFHGTGHGLGLEIHEAPRIGPYGAILRDGHVVTVEPGLYYEEMGGVRLEDVVVVKKEGCLNLTDFEKILEV